MADKKISELTSAASFTNDNDLIVIVSAANKATQKMTWANFKAQVGNILPSFSDKILDKIPSKTYTINGKTKTIISALNELYGYHYTYDTNITRTDVDNMHTSPVVTGGYIVLDDDVSGWGTIAVARVGGSYAQTIIIDKIGVFTRHYTDGTWSNFTRVSSPIINNLTTTESGKGSLDAAQGKNLSDRIASNDKDIAGLTSKVSSINDRASENNYWKQIESRVQSGAGSYYYPVGTEFSTTYTDYDNDNTIYDNPFIVVAHQNIQTIDGRTVPAMFIQQKWATHMGVPFDNYRALYYTKNGLAKGTYYLTIPENWGDKDVVKGVSYHFTLTKAVPAGGHLTGFQRMPDISASEWRVSSYASQTAATPIETVTPVKGSSGTLLGTWNDTKDVHKDNGDILASMPAAAYGYNLWAHSDARAWLNSNTTKWQRFGDNILKTPCAENSKHGYLAGLPGAFKNVIKPYNVPTLKNTISEDGSLLTTIDMVSIPSLEQMYIQKQGDGEGDYWPYYKNLLKASSPVEKAKIYPELISYAIENHSSPQTVRLRSAGRASACYSYYVHSSGGVYGSLGSNAWRFRPVCVIY